MTKFKQGELVVIGKLPAIVLSPEITNSSFVTIATFNGDLRTVSSKDIKYPQGVLIISKDENLLKAVKFVLDKVVNSKPENIFYPSKN